MNDRRGFMGSLVGALACTGLDDADVKSVSQVYANAEKPTVVLQLGNSYVASECSFDKMIAKLEEAFPNCKVIIIPDDMTLSIKFGTGVYHREKLDKYEIEIWAANEDDLKKRLEYLYKK